MLFNEITASSGLSEAEIEKMKKDAELHAASALRRATGGVVSAEETLRIQAVLDIYADHLLFSLLDMTEGGKTGAAVSSLDIAVDNFADLVKMARNVYMCRVVDVLEVRVG